MNKEEIFIREQIPTFISEHIVASMKITTLTPLIRKYGELCTAEMAEQLVKQLAEHKAQCAAKDAEIEKLKENWNEYDQLIKDYAYQSSEIERLKEEKKSILAAVARGDDLAFSLAFDGELSQKQKMEAEIERLNKLLNDGFDDAYQAGFSDGSDCYKN